MVDFPTRTDGEVLTAEQLNSYLQAIEDNDAAIEAHESDQANPHGTTKAQVGLGNVDNTSDASKPISTATQTALNAKANASHTHVATTDLTATGTKSSATFLRGDNTWATPPNTTYTAMSQSEAQTGTATTARTIDAARLKATIIYHAPVQVGHTHVVADLTNFAASVTAHADVSANTAARHTHANATVLNNTSASYTTAEESKLAGVEAGADVTDAANVNAAGAVMNSDTTTAAMAFVVDEDAMTSNSATKVPTQQSVKAYVDSGLGGKANTSHTHSISHVTSLQSSLDAKAAVSHSHDITDVTGLQTALDGKAASSHTHTSAGITDFEAAVEAAGDVAANTAARHSHTNAAVLNATTASYTTAEESKLSGIEAGADKTDATNVNAAGAVMTSDSSTAGMGFVVDEDAMTSNANTKVPTQQSVKAYVDAGLSGKANTSHTHTIANVTSLQSTLDGKAAVSHTHSITDVTGLQAALDGKASASHAHGAGDVTSGTFNIARIPTGTTGTTVALGNHTHTQYAATSHTHVAADISDLGATIAAQSDVAANTAARHTHNNTAVLDATTASFTSAEKTKLSGVAAGAEVNVNSDWNASTGDAAILNKPTTMPPSAHTHPTSEVTGLDTALSGKANTSHTHAVTDIDATGRTSSKYLRGDGTWATPTNTTYSAITQAEAENAASTTARLVTGQRLAQAVAKHPPATHTHVISDVSGLQGALDSKASTTHDHGSDYIWGGSWLSATATRIPVPITITGGKAYNDLPAAGSGANYGTSNAVARADHAHDYAPSTHTHAFISAAIFTIDGAETTITTGVKGDLYFPFGAVITGWTLLGDRTGSISISVWKDSYGNYPPTVVDDICGSETPTISSSTKGQDLSLTTWSPLISSGDTIRINVNSVTNIQRATLILHLYKTTN